VRLFLNAFGKACKDNFNLGAEVAIDEMMIQFVGRHKGTTHIKNKPIPRGFKMFALCDSKTRYPDTVTALLERGQYVTTCRPDRLADRGIKQEAFSPPLPQTRVGVLEDVAQCQCTLPSKIDKN
jgi:hypothetical protein